MMMWQLTSRAATEGCPTRCHC